MAFEREACYRSSLSIRIGNYAQHENDNSNAITVNFSTTESVIRLHNVQRKSFYASFFYVTPFFNWSLAVSSDRNAHNKQNCAEVYKK